VLYVAVPKEPKQFLCNETLTEFKDDITVRCFIFILSPMTTLFCPDLHREGHYEMMAGVCLSVCVSVACLDLI